MAAHYTCPELSPPLCVCTMQVQLNLWVAGFYADASSSLDSVAKELEAWLVSIWAAKRMAAALLAGGDGAVEPQADTRTLQS